MERRQRQRQQRRHGLLSNTPNFRVFTSRKVFRSLLIVLALIAILPPIYFHFRLRSFHQIQSQKCSWLRSLPLVCAHGGDSSKAFPNTADCIEVDVSRSSDGVLFALHDRELQRITGSNNSKVSYLSSKEIKELDAVRQLKLEHHDLTVPTLEDALKLISGSARRVILDAKVGPPLYEKEFAKDLLSVVDNTGCRNCLVWAKSDSFSRDVMKLSSDVMVGYIVMIDPSTGTRMKLLRLRGAAVVGVYHPLIDENLMKILRGRNKKVYAWTVDDEDSMKKMLFERVDAIVTSNPSLLQRLMQDVRTQCLEEGFSLSP
ncbi:glycerophosphodiester phosphodiesterase GDPD4 isoform X7 [Capsicum annuum]|uniref:glycerophosphodiester phosphodiesterase GDPD4 isoform X7 n=1 Tax=Capsicum annuum TaxID=4072 RepID=UPI001FB07DAD|nr:glycerophosphodiester phosphodiesterase GDPD4 isoform X7 [Capsicum annuum]